MPAAFRTSQFAQAVELPVAASCKTGRQPSAVRSIAIENLSKKFKGFTAIEEVTLDITLGEFFVVVGPSGCGKTTLLRILAGLDEPSGGRVEIDLPDGGDRPVNSIVFQGDSIFPWMTVYENAAYGLRMRQVDDRRIREVVGHYLDRTGLTKFADSYPHQLSGGMRQRVSIARAFANDPEILLMDEPFSALDAQNRLLLQEELLKIWEEHRKTVVFITHSVEEAVVLGDRIAVMTAHPGRIKSTVAVDLPRPRNVIELQKSQEFGGLVHAIWSSLRDEVQRARQLANQGIDAS